MKKLYINPVIEIVKIASQTQILTGSENLGKVANYGDGSGITLGGRDNDGDDW